MKKEKIRKPLAGTKPDAEYKAGSWDTEPSTGKAITADSTIYTYTYTQKGAAIVTIAPTAKIQTWTGAALELVSAGTASGGTMQYALGTDASTPPHTSAYSAAIPTGTEVGTYYVWYMAKGDASHLDSPAACVSAKIAEELASYGVVEGSDSMHVIGDGTTAVITVKRSLRDEKTFPNFTGVSVDGKTAAQANYTAKAGSLILTFKAEYLDTLSVGKHPVTIFFKDGQAQAALTIQAKSTPSPTPAPAPTETPRPVPQTGDAGHPALWFGLILLGIIALLALGRRKTE